MACMQSRQIGARLHPVVRHPDPGWVHTAQSLSAAPVQPLCAVIHTLAICILSSRDAPLVQPVKQAPDLAGGGRRPQPAVSIWSSASGIALDVLTNAPGLQFYSGDLLTIVEQ